MREYKKIHSSARPQDIEITSNAVYIAKNITPYEEIIDGRTVTGYEYDCEDYTKDEYLVKLARENEELRRDLVDTQLALYELYVGDTK